MEELFATLVLPNLPEPSEVEYQHGRLLEYCRGPAPLFFVRKVRGLNSYDNRHDTYPTRAGDRFHPTDNAPAWWMHYITFNGIRDADLGKMPTHMFDVRVVPNINTARFHVAHILKNKNRDVDWKNWTRAELEIRFIRNVHPCNCFYIPERGRKRYGDDRGVISFFADIYADRYRSIWREFLAAAGGEHPPRVPPPRFVYPAEERVPVERIARVADPRSATRYTYHRLCFKAAVIEPLNDDEVFEVITPEGVFRMMKAEFYADFSNVVASPSYRDRGLYHYPKTPKKALQYLA